MIFLFKQGDFQVPAVNFQRVFLEMARTAPLVHVCCWNVFRCRPCLSLLRCLSGMARRVKTLTSGASVSEILRLQPPKINESNLKMMVWFRCFFFSRGIFSGSILIFWGVICQVGFQISVLKRSVGPCSKQRW